MLFDAEWFSIVCCMNSNQNLMTSKSVVFLGRCVASVFLASGDVSVAACQYDTIS